MLDDRHATSCGCVCSSKTVCPYPPVRFAESRQPWVFFNLPAPDFTSARKRRAEREAREAEAAATGHGGAPKQSVIHEPPSLAQRIQELKTELGK